MDQREIPDDFLTNHGAVLFELLVVGLVVLAVLVFAKQGEVEPLSTNHRDGLRARYPSKDLKWSCEERRSRFVKCRN